MHVFSSHGVCNKNCLPCKILASKKSLSENCGFGKKACGEQLYVGGGSNRLPEVLI